MKTIQEQERHAYMIGDIDRAALLARIYDLLQRVDAAEKLLDDALRYTEDGELISPSGEWADQTRAFLEGRE
jgi:hypothetical protein